MHGAACSGWLQILLFYLLPLKTRANLRRFWLDRLIRFLNVNFWFEGIRPLQSSGIERVFKLQTFTHSLSGDHILKLFLLFAVIFNSKILPIF